MKDYGSASTQKISIGELQISRIGLGTNRITPIPQATQVLKRAVELGVQFIDTADIYMDHQSEKSIGQALSPYPQNVIIATKGGMTRDERKVDGSPEYLQKAVAGSLERLKLNQIYLYQLHRVDPKVPLAQSILALKKLQAEGKIKHIGLSEVTITQLKEAQKIAPIVSVQNEYNLTQRKHEEVINYCQANNLVFIPWFPLERGNISANKLNTLHKLAIKYNTTPFQLIIAWLLRRSPIILPIPGTLSVSHLIENFKSLDIQLTAQDFALINSP